GDTQAADPDERCTRPPLPAGADARELERGAHVLDPHDWLRLRHRSVLREPPAGGGVPVRARALAGGKCNRVHPRGVGDPHCRCIGRIAEAAAAESRRLMSGHTSAVAASQLQKLVWFVPEDALEATRDAVFAAGAGRIGDYERCSWYAAGTGTFLPREGADPAIGKGGREEREPGLRVEAGGPGARD